MHGLVEQYSRRAGTLVYRKVYVRENIRGSCHIMWMEPVFNGSMAANDGDGRIHTMRPVEMGEFTQCYRYLVSFNFLVN